MTEEIRNYVVEKTHALMEAYSCSKEAKAAAAAWLAAVGTGQEKAETRKYIAELEADIMPIDGLIAFAESEQGIQHFGVELAKKIAVHAREIKANGAVFCDCPACAAVADILQKKDSILL